MELAGAFYSPPSCWLLHPLTVSLSGQQALSWPCSAVWCPGPFTKRGLANLRICIFCAAAYGVGAFGGAQGAIYVAKHLGATGEGVVRLALGGILFSLAVYFIVGGDSALILAGLAGGSMFILGAMSQLMYQRQRKGRARPPQRREPVRRTRPASQKAKEQRPPTQGSKPTPKSPKPASKSPKPPQTNSGSQGGGY